MIIIIETFGGLCNQFYDINCTVNFCIINNIKFAFRYCSFRNKNLTSWYNEPFEKLFDIPYINKHNLYVDYNTLYLTNKNTYNLESNRAINLFTENYLNEIKNIDKEFIVLKQFWAVYAFKQIIDNLNPYILPSKRIMDIYDRIQNQIINKEQYNFIHYRYEHDFVNHFKCIIPNLKSIILNTKSKFKNPNLKIYIATSNIKQLIDLNDPEVCNIILTKNEEELCEYNFEELGFIDYMFGLNSNEIFGHNNSSFSVMLNHLKNTSNYYN